MAERLERTPHLTTAHAQPLADAIAQSYEGMAHWATTGPKGATCGGCVHWGDGTGPHQRAQERSCAKYLELGGVASKKVPRRAPACKHYEPAVAKRGRR
jgi:hypothetical protein